MTSGTDDQRYRSEMQRGNVPPPFAPPERGLAIRVIGPLEVRADGLAVIVDTRKALAILAITAVERRPIARDELAAMFWPEADDEAARGALRRTLSTLRASLGGRWFTADRNRVELRGDDVWVDAWVADERGALDAPTDLAATAALYRGEFLAGFGLRDSPTFDDWLATRAEERRRVLGDLLDRLGRVREADGDLAGATAAAARRLQLDSLDEAGHRRMMELLARAGDRAGAIRQYRQCVNVLERELGVAPVDRTSLLYEAIREGRLAPTRPTLPTAADSPLSDVTPSGSARPSSTVVIRAELPMVGREADVERLEAAWRTSAPDGRLAILVGEAGIGKTRLAGAIAEAAGARGGVVLAARSYRSESAIPFGAIGKLLRAGLARPDAGERLARLPSDALAQAARLVPHIRSMISISTSEELLAQPAARLRLVDGLVTTIVGLAAGAQPGLVWLDDLAWADASSLEVIAYLAHRLEGRSLLLLATWRREDVAGPLEALVDGAERQGRATVVALERLDREAIAALIRAVPERTVDAGALAAESEGLPLYVVELLTSVDEPTGSIPRGVRAVLAGRIADIDGAAAQVLAAAAVVGRSFDFELVRQTSGRVAEEAVDGLELLVRRGILRELPSVGHAPVGYDFVHGRLRDLAYEGVSLARRRLLHARAADAIRASHAPGIGEAARMALVGNHEREAGRFGLAAEAFGSAGRAAAAIHAPVEALAHLQAALALGHPDALAIRTAIGDARIQLGDYAGAIEVLEAAAADVTDPASLASIEHRLGTVHARRGDLTAADSHLSAALELLVGSDDLPSRVGDLEHARSRVLADRALVAHRLGDETRALSLAQLALAGIVPKVAPETPGPDNDRAAAVARARPLQVLGLVALVRGDLARATAHLEQALVYAVGVDLPVAVASRHALAQVAIRSGDVARATALAEAALVDGRRLGDRHVEAALENTLADVLHTAGREDEFDGSSQGGRLAVRRNRRPRRGAGAGDLEARRVVATGGNAAGQPPSGPRSNQIRSPENRSVAGPTGTGSGPGGRRAAARRCAAHGPR